MGTEHTNTPSMRSLFMTNPNPQAPQIPFEVPKGKQMPDNKPKGCQMMGYVCGMSPALVRKASKDLIEQEKLNSLFCNLKISDPVLEKHTSTPSTKSHVRKKT